MSKETSNNAAVNFLGRVMREQPEILEDLSSRDAYILFSHSDQVDRRTFVELGELFGISNQSIRQAYKKGVAEIHENANSSIQNKIPLNTIFESVGRSSPENKAAMSEAARRRWNNPEERAKLEEKARARGQSTEFREMRRRVQTGKKPTHKTRVKMSKAQSKAWEDPEKRKNRLAGLNAPETKAKITKSRKGLKADDITKSKLSDAQKLKWQDPEFRAKQTAARKGRKHTPEAKVRISVAIRRRSEDPEVKARRSEAQKRVWQDPERRVKASKGLKGRVITPEMRAKISETLKRRNDPDIQLWEYASQHGLIKVISEQNLMTPEDLQLLEDYINGNITQNKAQRVLNNFSELIARLA